MAANTCRYHSSQLEAGNVWKRVETWRKLKQPPVEFAGWWLMEHIPTGIATHAVISILQEGTNQQSTLHIL